MTTRTVHHADALPWLRERTRLAGASFITSLPDRTEVGMPLAAWTTWFASAARLVADATPDDGVAIFFQSDVRADGRWIDKAALVTRAVEDAGSRLLFHTIVCRLPAGTPTHGRATYSHLLGFSRGLSASQRVAVRDVIPEPGFMPTKKSMGVNACLDACAFVLRASPTRTVVDPFCGAGTVLAVANRCGLAAIGVDLSSRMCRRARSLVLPA